MTKKTTRRNIDIISKEEWKALVKAQELNRTQLLRSGMGTGTGTGTGPILYSQTFNIHQEYTLDGYTWEVSNDLTVEYYIVVDAQTGERRVCTTDANVNTEFTGGERDSISYGNYENVELSGNNLSFGGKQNTSFNNNTVTMSDTNTFRIFRTGKDEDGNEVDLSSPDLRRRMTLSFQLNILNNDTIDIESNITGEPVSY